MNDLKIFIIAGESSGDKLGANLIDGLLSELRGQRKLVLQGIGGPLMKTRGVVSLYNFNDLSVMGFIELVPNLVKILKIISGLSNYACAWRPDLIITIDSPDFSLKVAKKIKKMWSRAKIIHYVSPSVWAWRPNRAIKMAEFVDHVLAILPFEPPYMKKVGISCDFVGHPIVFEDIPSNQDIRLFRSSLGIDREAPIISVLPGSRKSEIVRMLPIYIKALKLVAEQFPNLILILASTSNVSKVVTQQLKKTNLKIIQMSDQDNPEKFEENKRILFSTSLAAIATSGTVTLELARMGAPFLVAYRASFISECIFRIFIKLNTVTLINILNDKHDIPELLFSRCNQKNIASVLSSLLTDEDVVARQRLAVDKAMIDLGSLNVDPKIRAARSVLNFLGNSDR